MANSPQAVSAAAPTNPKKKRDRSPSYPFISLRKAMERAKEFSAKEGKYPARVSVAVTHWGFKEKSSGGIQTIAALKAFGLMEDAGSSADRQVKLTDVAQRILGDERVESEERDKLIKEAALKPKIHRHLFEKWGVDFPSHETFRTYLKLDKLFADGALEDVITEYKDTLAYAKLRSGDIISKAVIDESDNGDDGGETPMEDKARERDGKPGSLPLGGADKRKDTPLDSGETERLRFNLKGGRRVRLMFTGHLPTQEDIDKLIKNLELNKDTFPEDVTEE
jgi:hypothetical protein